MLNNVIAGREDRKTGWFVLVIIIALIAGGVFSIFLNRSPRWAMYLFAGPVGLWVLYKINDPVYQLSTVLAALIFLEKTLISRQYPLPFLGVGPSLAIAIVVLFFFILKKRTGEGLQAFAVPLIMLLFLLVGSTIIGGYELPELMILNLRSLLQFYIEFFLFLYLGYIAFDNTADLKKYFFIMILFALCAAAWHLIAITLNINIEALRGAEAVSDRFDLSQGVWKYGGFFTNINNLSAYYVMLIPAALLYLYHDKNRMKKSLIAIAILIMGISLIFGASRGGLAFLVLNTMIALYFMDVSPRKILTIIFVTGIIIAVAFLIIQNYFSEFFQRSIALMAEKGLESGRYQLWGTTLKIIQDNPMGIGLNEYNFAQMVSRYGGEVYANPHNIYLQMMVQGGILGFIIASIVIIKILWQNWQAFRRAMDEESKILFAMLFVTVSGFLLMGLTEPIFMNSIKLNHILAIHFGIIISFSGRILRNNSDTFIPANGSMP